MNPGQKAVDFINCLEHVHGRWGRKPFDLRPWQEKIVRALFGQLNSDGKRRYRECGIWLPRKNGKSELCAAIALYMLLCEPEPHGQIYSAASEREQAALVFNTAMNMVRQNDSLASVIKILPSRNRMIYEKTGTFYQAISAEAGSKHGFNASCVIYDEIHCARNRDLYTVLTTSYGAREQPLTMTITTSGNYDPTTLEYELFDYACKVRDGTIEDDTYLPVIYAADKDDDWLDETVWHRVNPALGDFRGLEEMRQLAKRAKEQTSLENDFRRLYLNQHTAQTTRWLNMDDWKACAAEIPGEIDECWCGLDLSTKQDVTAFVKLFRVGDEYYVVPRFWIPEETALAKEKKDRVPYLQWKKEGHIEFTPGNRVDQPHITQCILQDAKRYNLRMIVVDPWNAESVVQDLMAELGADRVAEQRQNFGNANEPCRELEALMADRKIHHATNKCLDWMVSNVEVERNREGHIRPVKSSEINRIDGVVALVMAVGRAINAEPVSEFAWNV